MFYVKLINFCIIYFLYFLGISAKLNILFEWKQINYKNLPDYVITNIPSDTNASTLLNQTSYIPYNIFAVGISHYKGRLFIGVPRRNVGVPSTLNFINLTETKNERSPLLQGYPDYETNAITENLQENHDRIISVYRTKVDQCGRLWFVDTGILGFPGKRIQVQNASIWVIDLETNQRVRRFEIPSKFNEDSSGFVSITVDVDATDCDNAFAYIPNLVTFTLSVYSFAKNDFWTLRHNYFYLEPQNGDFNLNGLKFRWNDGIFSVALGARKRNGYRSAYFHAMASLNEYKVSTEVLQNSSLKDSFYEGSDFHHLGFRGKNMQTAIHDIDLKTGVMIFAAVNRNAVGCWNLQTQFKPSNIDLIEQDDEKMIYPSDLEIDLESNIWVMINQMPFYIKDKINATQFNYRVWTNSVEDTIKDSKCVVKKN